MEQYKNGVYRHFKGNLYKVICVGKSTDTEEEFVVYQALYGEDVWIRKKDEFFGTKILDDGTKVQRFTWVREN